MHLELICLGDNNYNLRFNLISLSGLLGLLKLGISSNKSASKSSFQEQDVNYGLVSSDSSYVSL